ncbi:multidrug efflux RND transporter permease subunit [Lawsonia intracellularis]|uniref:Acriflavin resistance protein D n=1 Tax=Lawsonia intracellularis (strain PHE/MN1-00) TaxID=363253 RepID=Q1MPM9_LAWIP|nr:multidrug efflux RND transporter permease subunit [Lawsonia intracellularis]AGC50425.1 RND efflux system inner membrane transporter [Lawsonia intracellularis N343]KAA0204448.1 multidrug efflux RND transporter permease subunit [Lawsonia intracellularis]MBZ3892873.1 multidrug efflux RND transporter permease subunit [Lawsonia intracellularis]RBN32967.1 multidrug efflux RND transporter permease subunit [Lawsonia intracellularis]RBN35529.1 multidrug efflux RND transporter permease subunit [Lawso
MSNKENITEVKEGFFLRRPIFSTVISLFITFIGILAIFSLPIEQYPNLTPPQVEIKTTYNGASANTVSESVASVLEEQVNGVDNMSYMNSVSAGTGTMTLTVTFDVGTDPEEATINVNNRVQLATPKLPQDVQRTGISVLKKSPAILQIVFLTSPDERYDTIFLSNYALLNIVDDLKRVPGVGDVQNFAGQDYAIRVWLKPDRMEQLKITPNDVINAINDQNIQIGAGRIGDEPVSSSIGVTWQIITKGRLETPEQFENIILRTEPDGSILRLKDIARIELGAQVYNFTGRQDGLAAIPIGIFLAPGANALTTAEAVRVKMKELSTQFPVGVAYDIPYDTTTFVNIAIKEVVKTLCEAMFLVFLVVYLFLQNWRATLIPCLAVPVSIVGTFAGMHLLGFSINTLTMFGLVLAIGIVVDDAIVVLENVERHISEGQPVHIATAKAMSEVTSAIIAIVLVLCAVFIPVAFIGGLAGRMYQQFAITIAVSVVISGVVALTFTPALCIVLLRNYEPTTSSFFKNFNDWFANITGKYIHIVKVLLRRTLLTICLFCLVLLGTTALIKIVPSGLVPDEDQGYFISLVMLPDGASLSRTSKTASILEQQLIKDSSVEHVMSFSGLDAISGASKTNAATIFVTLKPWGERKKKDESSFAIVRKVFGLGSEIPEGYVVAFNPPPISGMSNTGGFELWVQNRIGASEVELYTMIQKVLQKARGRKELQGLNSSFGVNAPQLFIELDREQAETLGVSISDVFSAMQSTFGSYYVNDFNLYGRTFRVYTQSESDYRALPENIKEVYVRNRNGEMVPIISLLKVKPIAGSQIIERFNGFPAAKIMGSPASGYSSGQAMDAIESVAKEVLPEGYTLAWSGSSYQERVVSGGGSFVLLLSLIMVFLILAAQYESWSLPLTILTAVPFAAFGAILAIWLRGIANDVYFQVALITLVGLSAKNAILIVEFAVEKYRLDGMNIIDAIEEASRLRFRPIIMTSLAFILGCVPLAISTGAGAASRHAIGTSVIGGMLLATIIAPLFIPFFFRWIMVISEKFSSKKSTQE